MSLAQCALAAEAVGPEAASPTVWRLGETDRAAPNRGYALVWLGHSP